jgi:hypothetical protein
MRTAASVLAVACLGACAAAQSSPTARVAVVPCAAIVAPAGSFAWRPKRVVLGVAAVPPAFVPQAVEAGSGRWPFWSKSGLAIRASSPPVLVSVPARFRDAVAVEWGSSGPVSALRFASCAGGGPLGDWNPYAGGFLLRARAACVPLTFRVGARTATVRFGVGKRCG